MFELKGYWSLGKLRVPLLIKRAWPWANIIQASKSSYISYNFLYIFKKSYIFCICIILSLFPLFSYIFLILPIFVYGAGYDFQIDSFSKIS